MAFLRDQAFPLADYPTGVYESNPTLVDSDVKSVYLEIKRCTSADTTIWPNETTTIKVSHWASWDNGQTWKFGGSVGAYGGIHIKADQVTEAPTTTLECRIPPQEGNKKRRYKVKIEIAGGPLRSEGYFELRT
jgi:hypothetical protein